MRPTKTYDKERLSLNLARMKKGGEVFEVIIDPDNIIAYKSKKKMPVRQVLKYEKVFSDAKKGFEASHDHMKSVFGTDDVLEVAEIIVNEGDIQFTQEYREQKRQEKKNKVLDIIVRNAIDPRSNLPHPRTRIESAMDEAKIRIDNFKDAQDQIKDIVHALKPVLPISLASKVIQLKIPPQYGAKAYSTVERFGKIMEDNWQSDGSWVCTVEIAAGIQNEFFDALNKLTSGEVESKIVKER